LGIIIAFLAMEGFEGTAVSHCHQAEAVQEEVLKHSWKPQLSIRDVPAALYHQIRRSWSVMEGNFNVFLQLTVMGFAHV